MSEGFFHIEAAADDQTLLTAVAGYYQTTLKAKPEALDYLTKRGIAGEAIDRFSIGYCDWSLLQHLPDRKDAAGKLLRERLERLGLLHGRGRESFLNFLVFPVAAADGSNRIVDFYGRRIFDNSHKSIPNHKHLAPDRPGVWNLEAFAAGEELIVCPSLFDALSFWTHGCRNVTCTFDESLSADFRQALQKFPVRRLLTPSRRIGLALLDAGIDCFLIVLPDGTDANG